jgi:hypothetical protein
VVPSTFGERKVPPYGFVRKSDGVEIATVPYQDRDAIFSYEDNCIFQSMSFVSGHVKHWIASTRWWRINPITITFGWVPSI